ncbi:hypothetical protein AN161_03015 [Lysinibacillus sp. FJAT-14222]|nr:hypothetical protein AN161_03015 [Lysinibacillus sp. FJAT-14222]
MKLHQGYGDCLPLCRDTSTNSMEPLYSIKKQKSCGDPTAFTLQGMCKKHLEKEPHQNEAHSVNYTLYKVL